ncbi:uncharacterized protein LOC133203241 [Saccostrea echinata]|uniref:uncharacterized protein LOC133203241 n=1 Tax=Saccostrea echinata TaxID=191078 RepID=UPI002A83B8F7|nr:uncharacterized protein LOC133203241 [Saccostrea echinata]
MAASIGKCSISVYTPSCCSFPPLHPSEISLIRLKDCKRGIVSHLLKNGIRSGMKGEADVFSEADLICKRVRLFTIEEAFTVCPYHRDFLGVHWRPKTSCQYPDHQGNAKPYRSFNSLVSKRMVSEFGTLVPIGSGICRKCHGDYLNLPSSIGMIGEAQAETDIEAWSCRLRTRKTETVIYEV